MAIRPPRLSPGSLALLTSALLTYTSIGRTQGLWPIDNFESYTNATALARVWSNYVGSAAVALETNMVCEGGQSLRFQYSVGTTPFTNTIAFTFPVPEDWSTFNTFNFSYGGAPGNSSDNVILQLLDPLGGVLGTFIVSGGTTTVPCKDLALDLSAHGTFTNASHGTSLKNVQTVVLGVVAGYSHGSGTVFFDNIVVGNNGNVITNPGFQDLNNDGVFGDGWNSFGAEQFNNQVPMGNPGDAAFFGGTNGNWGGISWPASPVTNGVKYRFTIMAGCQQNWNAPTQIGLQFLGADKTTVVNQRSDPMFTTNPATSNPRSYSMIATVPSGASYILPFVSYTNSVADTNGYQGAFLDNALLAVETSRRLSILGSSVATGYNGWGLYSNLDLYGSVAGSYGAYLTTAVANHNWHVFNQSIPGDNTPLVTARFYRDEVPVGADEVLIGLSLGNEGLPGATNPLAIYNQFYSGITNLIAMSRSNNLLPLVGCGYPRNTYTTNEYVYLKNMDLLLNTLDVPSVNFLGATDDGQGHWPSSLYGGDVMHPNSTGHYEMFLCIVPSVFDALMAGKTTPRMSSNSRFVRILADPPQPAPLSFTPAATVHSFSVSFRVRSTATGVVASVTLPGTTNHPTVEITPTGLAYVASSGQMIGSGVTGTDGTWHDIVVAHQYIRSLTKFYVDAVLAGTTAEQLTPIGFVLGGHGSAVSRPNSPAQADYENWFVHRSVLNAEEVQAQFRGALQQASLEVYAPLDDPSFVTGLAAQNLAQSLSVVAINGGNLYSQSVVPISYFGGAVTLNLPGLPGLSYEAQRSITPNFSAYTVLFVGNAPSNGVVSLIDTNPPAPSGFYRLQQR